MASGRFTRRRALASVTAIALGVGLAMAGVLPAQAAITRRSVVAIGAGAAGAAALGWASGLASPASATASTTSQAPGLTLPVRSQFLPLVGQTFTANVYGEACFSRSVVLVAGRCRGQVGDGV
ncbi:hypothetical protein ACC691_36675, partial [Rhizobium johnstonii]|uniref:hypothetical protein n=1 Tax=Rhizobium johnstonii TaxID=3019933 RepID=UPI003F96528E